MIRIAHLTRQRVALTVSAVVLSLAVTAPAYASGSPMPREAPLQQILQSIEGPVAKIIAIIIIITTGLALAFGDTSGGHPLAFHLTEGEVGDRPLFKQLLDLGPDVTPRAARADKGYDAKANRARA